jgi:hypothetical protein
MKYIFICSFMLFLSNAGASIEYSAKEDVKPTEAEITRNRSCFHELSQNGCGDPGENLKEFRTCLHDVFPKLTDNCQTMMSKLYGKKN